MTFTRLRIPVQGTSSGGRSSGALSSTCLDPDPSPMPDTNMQHDVIVIGAGIAGLVAANRAAQLGLHVVVIEKGEDQRYLCNSRYTYGTFHITYTDVGADEDVLVDRIEACTDGFASKDLA